MKCHPSRRITDDDFAPAFDAAIEQSRERIAAIVNNTQAPGFDNTIAALEGADQALDRVLGVFLNLAGSDSNPKREALQLEFAPKLAAYSSEITMNEPLFERVEALWRARDSLGLAPEQSRVLMLTRRGFVRAGAQLRGGARKRLKKVKERLAVLSTEFVQNLLADERDWVMELATDDLQGLPDFVVAAAKSAGEEKGLSGHIVTLSRSLIVPFLQFSPRRELREQAYQAWSARGANGGDTDNRAIATEVLGLRAERAHLLGYDNFAAYKLETEMAKTPQAARDLLMQVWAPARQAAEADGEVLTQMMHADGINEALQPWDWRYYARVRCKSEHDLDEAEIKPYLQLDRMIKAAFACANRLFGLDFAPLDIGLYHPERPRLGGDARRPSPGGICGRLLCPRLKTLRRLVLGDAQPTKTGRRHPPDRRQCVQLRAPRRKRTGTAVIRRRPHPVPRIRPRPAPDAVRCDLPVSFRNRGGAGFCRTAQPAL